MTEVDLITWLRARLDDDERAAHAWLPFGNPAEADRDHIARQDPGRALAEVDAKRRIVDLAERQAEMSWDVADTIVRWLAYPYADRPGYRDEEWRP